jgi:hypothetical protein
MLFRHRQTKSPVPDPSLPHAGQSLQLKMIERLNAGLLIPVIVAVFLGLLSLVESLHRIIRKWPSPWVFNSLFFVSVVFCIWRYWATTKEIRQLHQGMRGERIVGQMLEDLRPLGCKVYHDICEDGFNIDHVIIGPYGVFSVETKAPSKPEGNAVVTFDGETVTVGGYEPDRDPIVQARASASRVRKILRETSGVEPRVTPVVLYVNWFVENYVRNADVIVMNQNYFFKSFDRLEDRNTLDPTQVNLLAASLERYLRSKP